MKLMSSLQLLALLPSTQEEMERAADLFPSILAASFQPGYYRTAFKEQWVYASTVWKDGHAVGLVGWHRTRDAGLFVDCIVKFAKEICDALMWDALKLLEKQQHVGNYVRFLTTRRGLASLAESHGFTPTAIMMQKSLA